MANSVSVEDVTIFLKRLAEIKLMEHKEELKAALDEKPMSIRKIENAYTELHYAHGMWASLETALSVAHADDTDDFFVNSIFKDRHCRNEWAEFGKFRCSECGLQVDAISTNTTRPISVSYCPNCGRKVVDA